MPIEKLLQQISAIVSDCAEALELGAIHDVITSEDRKLSTFYTISLPPVYATLIRRSYVG